MRPVYDLAGYFAAQIITAEQESGRVYEPMVGIVTDNKDPAKLGRVRVKLPVFSEQDASYWAPIIMMGAGKNRGWFFIPECDDEVLVMFEHGDANRPVVLGALWNGKDKPPAKNPGGNPRRVIKSRQGSQIVFDDENDVLVIEDGTGKGRITLDAKANKVMIEAIDGDVCFQSPRGDMQIVCKSAKLTAGQNIEIHAGGAMRWGTDASATINGGASSSLSGANVNINCGIAQAPPAPTSNPQDVPDPYEARAIDTSGRPKAAAAPVSNTAAASATRSAAGGAGSASASASASATPSGMPPLEPTPVLVSAAWDKSRVPVSTSVKLSAQCTEMTGKTATIKVIDADDESVIVATLNATCSADKVEATWTTPSSAPPAKFVFEVSADGKQSASGVLTLINTVEVKLILDDEPAQGIRVRLRVESSGEELTAEADDKGIVRFEEAPFGEYSLLLAD